MIGCSPKEENIEPSNSNESIHTSELPSEKGVKSDETDSNDAANQLINEISQETRQIAVETLLLNYGQEYDNFYSEIGNHLITAFSGVTKEDEKTAREMKINILSEFESEDREVYDRFVDELIDIEIQYNE